MMPQSIGAVLFDFDGTLADTAPVHARAFRRALDAMRFELACEFDYEAVRGMRTRDAFMHLGLTGEAQIDAASKLKQAFYREFVQEGALRLFPGAKFLLNSLQRSGVTCILVTSGSRGSISGALDALGLVGCFADVVTSDDAARGKPDPDPYLAALERNALRSASCIAVEDAPSGARSAAAAGLCVFGVHNRDVAPLAAAFFADIETLGRALVPLVKKDEVA